MAKDDRIVSFILPDSLLGVDTRSECHDKGGTISWQGGTRYGCDIWSGGGTMYSATDGPGGPILRGDHPQRDSTTVGDIERCRLCA